MWDLEFYFVHFRHFSRRSSEMQLAVSVQAKNSLVSLYKGSSVKALFLIISCYLL